MWVALVENEKPLQCFFWVLLRIRMTMPFMLWELCWEGNQGFFNWGRTTPEPQLSGHFFISVSLVIGKSLEYQFIIEIEVKKKKQIHNVGVAGIVLKSSICHRVSWLNMVTLRPTWSLLSFSLCIYFPPLSTSHSPHTDLGQGNTWLPGTYH